MFFWLLLLWDFGDTSLLLGALLFESCVAFFSREATGAWRVISTFGIKGIAASCSSIVVGGMVEVSTAANCSGELNSGIVGEMCSWDGHFVTKVAFAAMPPTEKQINHYQHTSELENILTGFSFKQDCR
jgi:hypothetical protein